jgi:hypothetical protein
MAEPFGDKHQDAGKRPAQTIEGIATEVLVEPAPDAGAPVEAGPEPKAGEAPYLAGSAAGPAEAERGVPPRTSLPELKSFMTHLAAGVLGGLIGVIGLAFAWGGLDSGKESGPPPDLAGLEERLAKLEADPASPADAEAMAQLESRITALEVDTGQAPAELGELAGRVAQLESSLKALAETASEGGSVAEAAAIGQQIAEAEQRLDAKIAAALAEREATNTAALKLVQGELAELKAKFGALAEAELGGDTANPGPELNALSDRIAKLEATLPDLVGAIGKEAQGAKSAAAAIAFANLRAAVSDGRPYAAELDTVGTLALALGDLGVLPTYAEKGIPTLPELARSFDVSRDNALAAVAPVVHGSLFDSLWASAQSLVTIRRIDEAPTGEGPDASLARAGAALGKGDLAGAVQEVETLEGPAREVFSLWLGQARARLGADAILTRLEGVLLVSMGGAAQQRP